MYAAFAVKAEDRARIDEVLKDDIVSRQSIAVREGSALGFPDLGVVVLVEGAEAAVARAGELFKDVGARIEGEKSESVYRAFKSQEDDAASGIGLIFG